MNEEQTVEVSAADWEATPASVQRLVAQLMLTVQQLRSEVAELRRENDALRKENEALRTHNALLTARVADLEEKLRTNSRNSSKPPSSDPPSTPPTPPSRGGKNKRSKGGQKGHKGHHRALLPPEQVDTVVVCKPSVCSSCEQPLRGEDAEPQRHQVHELAAKLIHTTEYQLHSLRCPCGAHTRATLPSGVGRTPFGPSIQALSAVLVGGFKLSHAAVVEMMRDVFGLAMSIGAVTATLTRASDALEPVHQEATIAVRKADVAHADETSWRVAGKKAWLWVLCTPLLEVFRIAKGRGATSCRKLLGRVFKGTLVTDRYSVYARFASKQQYCHSHLYRDWLKVEQRGEDEEIGRQLRRLTRRLLRASQKTTRGTDAGMAAQTARADPAIVCRVAGARVRARQREDAGVVRAVVRVAKQAVDVRVERVGGADEQPSRASGAARGAVAQEQLRQRQRRGRALHRAVAHGARLASTTGTPTARLRRRLHRRSPKPCRPPLALARCSIGA